MPLKGTKSTNKKVVQKTISNNIRELHKDNEKTGKERGANGKKRSDKQIIAIAINAANKPKKEAKKKSATTSSKARNTKKSSSK